MPASERREDEHGELVRLDAVAEEPGAALGVADRAQHAAGPRRDDEPAGGIGGGEGQRRELEEHDPRRRALQVEAREVLEVGEPVVAAEPHVVAEEGEHQREAERLRHDRQIDAA